MNKHIGTGMIVAGLVLLCLGRCAPAEARTFRFLPLVPTVPGIEDHSPRYSPYPGPVRRFAPSSDVLRVDEAPANGCGPGRFEVVSGPKAQRGCY